MTNEAELFSYIKRKLELWASRKPKIKYWSVVFYGSQFLLSNPFYWYDHSISNNSFTDYTFLLRVVHNFETKFVNDRERLNHLNNKDHV